MRIIFGHSGRRSDATVESLREALDEAAKSLDDPFVIIERSEQHYMQCLAKGGWQLEKREGDWKRHFQGSRSDDRPSALRSAFLAQIAARGEFLSSRLDREDVEAAMTAYLSRAPDPDWLIWTPMAVC